jgi:hypothetical protein
MDNSNKTIKSGYVQIWERNLWIEKRRETPTLRTKRTENIGKDQRDIGVQLGV